MSHIDEPPYECIGEEQMGTRPWHPSSAKRDQKALNKLMKAIEQRNQGKY